MMILLVFVSSRRRRGWIMLKDVNVGCLSLGFERLIKGPTSLSNRNTFERNFEWRQRSQTKQLDFNYFL